MIADKILEYLSQNKSQDDSIRYEAEKLAGVAFRRQFQEFQQTRNSLSLSSSGKCPRQLSYRIRGFEINGKEMDSRSNINFFMGDVSEMMILSLARAAGLQITAYGLNQITCHLTIPPDVKISGHPDGLLFQDGKTYLVEVKSMNEYSFSDFQKGIIEYSYLCQVNSYMEALGLEKCIFIALNKNSGVLHEMVIKKDADIVNLVKIKLAEVLKSKDDVPNEGQDINEILPERMYKPDENGKYPWQCRYCPYFKTCLPNTELVLSGKSYVLKTKKEK